MTFAHPQLLLLLAPVALFHGAFLRRARGRWLKSAVLALLTLAAADPRVPGRQTARRTVVLVDRSRSVGQAGLAEAQRLLDELGATAAHETWLVGFGEGAQLLARPGEHQDIVTGLALHDASELTEGLRLAALLSEPEQPAQIVVVSDGLSTSGDPLGEVGALRERGALVYALPLTQRAERDARVSHLSAPAAVPVGQRYSLAVEVASPLEQRAELALLDGDEREVGRLPVTLKAGANRFNVPLRAGAAGTQRLAVRLLAPGDPVPDNDVARAVVRVVGAPRVLVFNQDGTETALVRALAQSGLAVDVRREDLKFSSATLQGVAAVALENVPLERLGERGDRVLDRYVRDLGGGLLITGGRASFARGGYFRSAVEELLPVVMDRKEELQRPKVALGVVLDRSGSMSAMADERSTKMALANRAAIEAINFLAPGDQVAVFAVDEAAHRVVGLTALEGGNGARRDVVDRVGRIESEGGGIYVHTGLAAAMNELLGADAPTRHILLFSDASDSEEPGNYWKLVTGWAQAGGTLSVVGLGTREDPDAALLEDIARLGEGRAFFTTDARQLPRVFAQDVMFVARRTFIEERAAVAPARGLLALGFSPSTLPDVGGYNLTYLAAGAEPLLVTTDENAAPLAASWQRGLGRVMALAFEVDGPFTGPLAEWPQYQEFLRSCSEWVRQQREGAGALATVEVRGRRAVATVELDPAQPRPQRLRAVVMAPNEEPLRDVALRYVGPHTLEAEFSLRADGVYHGVVQLGDATVELPPVTLPYSPEFAQPGGAEQGLRTLTQLSQATGGRLLTDGRALRETSRVALPRVSLAPWLVGAALALLLLEIAQRKGLLAPLGGRIRGLLRGTRARVVGARARFGRGRRARVVAASSAVSEAAAVPSGRSSSGRSSSGRSSSGEAATEAAGSSAGMSTEAAGSSGQEQPSASAEAGAHGPPGDASASASGESVLALAKRRARRGR